MATKIPLKKVGEWAHRIIGFTIFQSFITVIGFVGLHYSMIILTEMGLMNFGVNIGLLQFALATCYLQIANLLYWLGDINLFDFKKLWRKDGN